jgi:flagellar protein FliO/FliZ
MMVLLLQAAAGAAESADQLAELPGGYGLALLQTLLALAAVCVLAWVVLRWAAQRGLGLVGGGGARVQVMERVPLDARRTLWLVKAGGKVLLLGAGDGASPNLLAELREQDLEGPAVAPRKSASFLEVLRRGALVPPAASSQPPDVPPAVVPPRDEGPVRPAGEG